MWINFIMNRSPPCKLKMRGKRLENVVNYEIVPLNFLFIPSPYHSSSGLIFFSVWFLYLFLCSSLLFCLSYSLLPDSLSVLIPLPTALSYHSTPLSSQKGEWWLRSQSAGCRDVSSWGNRFKRQWAADTLPSSQSWVKFTIPIT